MQLSVVPDRELVRQYLEGNQACFKVLLERHRQKIFSGVNGQEKEMPLTAIKKFLTAVVSKADQAIEKAKTARGLIATYFTHEVTEYDTYDRSNHDGFSFVRPRAFKRHALPLFLEGFVHALRIEKNPKRAAKLFEAVKKSPLYDKALKMYKVNADLSSESEEIGKNAFSRASIAENSALPTRKKTPLPRRRKSG